MSAPDRVLGRAEAILQIVEDRLSNVEQLVATLRDYERRVGQALPDIEQLRSIVPDLRDEIASLRQTTWMTSTECGRHLRMHRDTVTRLAREGILPAHRIGELDDWRFDRHEVDAAVKRGALVDAVVEMNR